MGRVHEDGRVRTFTCDMERSVVGVLRCYGLHGQLVTTSRALTQIRLDIVSGEMNLKPSREDVCETFRAGRLETGALCAAGNPLAGRVSSRRRCLTSLLTLRLTSTCDWWQSLCRGKSVRLLSVPHYIPYANTHAQICNQHSRDNEDCCTVYK